jgi:chemotaxis protein CheD
MYSGPQAKPATALETGLEDAEEYVPEEGGKDKGRLAVYLLPGRIFVSPEPCTLRMVLGSCVAVCLWDPLRVVGGANHFLLPYPGGNGQDSPRFGNVATQRLIEKMLAFGCTKPSLVAKLFGGSCVLEAFQNKETHLGTKNVSVARKLLEAEGIPVVAEDVGGQRGRKVIFRTDDGSAWVRRL